MIHHRLSILNDWQVDVFINDGGRLDIGLITDCLYDMGANEGIVGRAVTMIEDDIPNEAFTYSNRHCSCIYIGWTTSGEEFINSIVHEAYHLVHYIAQSYGIENEEKPAYLIGDVAFLLAKDICELGCTHCRKQEKGNTKWKDTN